MTARRNALYLSPQRGRIKRFTQPHLATPRRTTEMSCPIWQTVPEWARAKTLMLHKVLETEEYKGDWTPSYAALMNIDPCMRPTTNHFKLGDTLWFVLWEYLVAQWGKTIPRRSSGQRLVEWLLEAFSISSSSIMRESLSQQKLTQISHNRLQIYNGSDVMYLVYGPHMDGASSWRKFASGFLIDSVTLFWLIWY